MHQGEIALYIAAIEGRGRLSSKSRRCLLLRSQFYQRGAFVPSVNQPILSL